MAANPILRVIESLTGSRPLAQSVAPRLTFDDVILPDSTRRALEQALAQVRQHDLIFRQWGLGERYATGQGLAFNFAGPPGTGKSICAEAVAHALGRRLLVVRYAEVESMWVGETPKNVSELFRSATEENAVLLFDEADSIAARRSTSPDQSFTREANAVVNVLLKELEAFRGVVIFATNLAANFDPAFERRIRQQVLFEVPDAKARERIWRAQMHPRTPLARDVDFRQLGEQFEVAGGDIRNAVLKAAAAAAMEPTNGGPLAIRQRHLDVGAQDVIAGKRVMQQSLFVPTAGRALETTGADLQPAAVAGVAWSLGMSVAALVTALAALIAALVF